MPLFNDGLISGIEDLTGYDSQLLETASAEKINLDRKLSLAQEEIRVEIAALLNTAGRERTPRAHECENVVVTPALKLWHTFRTLEMSYSDAYHNQLNDRFAGKREGFKTRAEWARERLLELGIGIALAPVPQAAPPVLSTVNGGLAPGAYYVSMCWLNARGQEGAQSTAAFVDVQEGTFCVNPGDAPKDVTGWNVYAGLSSSSLSRQNGGALQVGSTWTQPAVLTTAGPPPSLGQTPDACVPIARVIERG